MKDLTKMKLNDKYITYETGNNKKIIMTKAAIEFQSIFNTISDLKNKVEYLKFLCKKEGIKTEPIEEKKE